MPWTRAPPHPFFHPPEDERAAHGWAHTHAGARHARVPMQHPAALRHLGQAQPGGQLASGGQACIRYVEWFGLGETRKQGA